jgi:hypothetical protein
MAIKSTSLGFLIFVTLIGGMFLGSALDLFNMESARSQFNQQSQLSPPELTPEDIRGSHRLGEISAGFDIPLELLKQAFLLPDEIDASNFRCGDLEALYADLGDDIEIGTGSVKLFAAFYSGEPYAMDDEDYLLSDAVEILLSTGTLTEEQLQYLQTHTLDSSGLTVSFEAVAAEFLSEEHADENGFTIQGRTTFADLYAWGIPQGVVEEIVGRRDPEGTIREYCEIEGLRYSEIKSELQAELDRMPR